MLLDSAAWIEFFKGSKKGQKVRLIIIQDQCYTSILSIGEIGVWCIKNGLDEREYIAAIEKNSVILNLRKEIMLSGAVINVQHKKNFHNWGMIDALIYATARLYGLIVLTKDTHFQDLDGVEML